MQDLNNNSVQSNEVVNEVVNVGVPTTADENEIPHTDEVPVKEEEPAQEEQAQEVMVEGKPFHEAFVYDTPYGVVASFESQLPQSVIDDMVEKFSKEKDVFHQIFGEETEFKMEHPTEESVKQMKAHYDELIADQQAPKQDIEAILAALKEIFKEPVLNPKQEHLVELLDLAGKSVLMAAGAMAEHSFEPQENTSRESGKIVKDAFLDFQENMELLAETYEQFLNRRNAAVTQQRFLNKIASKLEM